ncbi:hypothetical protein [Xanthobacter pseudotagetidis]|uniref:hypothetical protein n=1 Tax=Xanthobacter pseudotagetidis TaxID=3119911 RepID=UPI00372A62E4
MTTPSENPEVLGFCANACDADIRMANVVKVEAIAVELRMCRSPFVGMRGSFSFSLLIKSHWQRWDHKPFFGTDG